MILKEEEKIRWKLINKLDWRIALPIGAVIIFFVSQGKVRQDSFIYWVGIFCVAAGIVNITSKFMFRQPIENLKSMSLIGDYSPNFFKRNIIAVFVLIIVLAIGFWAISSFN